MKEWLNLEINRDGPIKYSVEAKKYKQTLNQSFKNSPEQPEICLSTPKLINLIDGTLDAKMQNILRRHLMDCLSCQKQFAQLQKADKLINHHIPSPHVEEGVEENIQSEIQELVKRVRKEYQAERSSKYILKGKWYFKEWSTLLTSKDMLFVYSIAVLFGIVLKNIL